MKFKRAFSFFLSFILIISLVACNGNDKKDISEDNSEKNTTEIFDKIIEDETTADISSIDISDKSDLTQAEETIASENEIENISEWSKEQIVEVYKNAAQKSNSSAKSAQSINLKNISVNNGQYEGLFEFITPIMSKLLANNSTDKDGITGGYINLTSADVAQAKVYKMGNNIAIELVMLEQTSGANDDALSGSVGHAITAVGDIGEVVQQLTDLGLPLEISEKDTKIYYTNPVVKVLINSNGEIVSGTWRYTVEISLNNYKAFGKAVETTSVVMDNIITVNGGFKK